MKKIKILISILCLIFLSGCDYINQFFPIVTNSNTQSTYESTSSIDETITIEDIKNEINIENVENIVDDIVLIKKVYDNIDVTWESSSPSIITNEGIVIRPMYGETDEYVSLTASFSYKGTIYRKVFYVTVKAVDDEMYLDEIINDFTLAFSKVDNDIILPKNYKKASITWESNCEFLTNNGYVTRPNYEEGNKEVELTATLKVGNYSKEKKFSIIVLAKESTVLIDTFNSLTLGDTFIITEDLVLPTNIGEVIIVWKSNDHSVLSDDGKINPPNDEDGDKIVVLTATLSYLNKKLEKEFILTIKAKISDRSILNSIYEKLTIPNMNNIITDIDLYTVLGNAEIEWTSSNENIITNKGKVIRPSHDDGDISVTLTAVLYYKNLTMTKTFDLTVKAEPEFSDINPNYTDSYKYMYNGPKVSFMNNWVYAGLYNVDGSIHVTPKQNITTGKTLNVLNYGAKANDASFDNTDAIKRALSYANSGDEIYFPSGSYYFSTASSTSPYYAHINGKSGVNIRGAGRDTTTLISNFNPSTNQSNSTTTTLSLVNVKDVVVSGLSFTANIPNNMPMPQIGNTTANNPEGNKYVPSFAIVIQCKGQTTKNIVVKDSKIEYFRYAGIRIHSASDNTIENVIIQNATDIGGGGAGYGICIRGYGHEQYQYIDTIYDCRFNIFKNVTVNGPYIRHGIIFSYMAHNNLVYNCNITKTADDAYDLHGQDEFLNVISYSSSTSSGRAAVGLGNTGSSHDATGCGNVIYGCTFISNYNGITVTRGTNYTQIINNSITSTKNNAIYIDSDSKNTTQTNNKTK